MTPAEILKRLEVEGTAAIPKIRLEGSKPSPETFALVTANRDALLRHLVTPEIIPHLPWQLERLIAAASSGVLPEGTHTLPSGLVTDLNRYVLAWGSSYLIGDRNEALRRLWEAHRAWQGVN